MYNKNVKKTFEILRSEITFLMDLHISENNLLTPFQSGFIQGDSTTFQLLHTFHSFLEAVDSGKEV